MILFGAGFANTFPRIVPGVEIKAVYEIIVSHTAEQGICALNRAIPASPPQCLTVTEGINIKFNLLGFVIPTERFKSIILTFLYNPSIVSYSALIPLGHLWLWLRHSVALTIPIIIDSMLYIY